MLVPSVVESIAVSSARQLQDRGEAVPGPRPALAHDLTVSRVVEEEEVVVWAHRVAVAVV